MGGTGGYQKMLGTNVDFVGDNRVIFDIGGNKYRLIVHVAHADRLFSSSTRHGAFPPNASSSPIRLAVA
nr:type II toxin-antitoxin system HigB family toxin [Rhizobium esperanzae]